MAIAGVLELHVPPLTASLNVVVPSKRSPDDPGLRTEDIVRFHIVTRGDITRVEDLKGKRVGFSSIGALSHLAFMQLAQKMGWDAKADLSMFANGAGPKELKSKKIDAYAAGSPTNVVNPQVLAHARTNR